MKEPIAFSPDSWLYQWDAYRIEANSFTDDVHRIILTTLSMAIEALRAEAEPKDKQFKDYIEAAEGYNREMAVEKQIEHWQEWAGQERFLRNIALVALLSRLIHALNRMARAADATFERKKGKYRKNGDSEFTEIWREYDNRFAIDMLEAHKDKVVYIDPLRHLRNRIVHSGGEANLPRHRDDIDISAGDEGFLITDFSENYPQFVEGSGFSAEVRITEEQLNDAVEYSLELVKWLAAELRAKELHETEKLRTIASE